MALDDAAGGRSPSDEVQLGVLSDVVGYHLAQAAVVTYDLFERHVGELGRSVEGHARPLQRGDVLLAQHRAPAGRAHLAMTPSVIASAAKQSRAQHPNAYRPSRVRA